MRQLLTFLFLQNKRLLKRPGFISVFLLVPILVILMSFASDMESSVLKIAVCPGKDSAALESIRKIDSKESVIKFDVIYDKEKAINLVKQGKADAAWVFSDDYSEIIRNCVRTGKTAHLVTSYQPEDNPLLMLAMFRLNVVMYPQFMHESYREYTDSLNLAEKMSEAEIEAIYENNNQDVSFFEMRYMDEGETVSEKIDYLTAPLRGLLALWLMLTAFAATVYYMFDEKEGLFERIPLKYRTFVGAAYIGVPVFDAALVMLVTLFITGINTSPLREFVNIFIFAINVVLFSEILKNILNSQERFVAAIPVLMLMMLVLCPVFITVKNLRAIQFVLPPFFYLKATHAWIYTGFGAVLMAGLICVNIGISLLKRK